MPVLVDSSLHLIPLNASRKVVKSKLRGKHGHLPRINAGGS